MPEPEESLLSSPLATRHQNPEQQIQDAFGHTVADKNDPAWQPPTDPLKRGDVKARATIINRQIPNVVVQSGWDIDGVRRSLIDLTVGNFNSTAQLVDSVIGDSRVQACLASRTSAIQGRPMQFKQPDKLKGSRAAKECYDAWTEHWPSMATEPVLSDMQVWGALFGFWTGQVLWDTSGPVWKPYIQPWHPQYTYYHWQYRLYVAMTQDGQVPIEPGDGHWVLHAPYGEYRGWMRGAIRAIAPWWLARNYALRDWARYSERHGMPIGLAKTPAGADIPLIDAFRLAVSQLGQESILQLPTSGDPMIGSYDFQWLETKDQSWDGFLGLITQCNSEITLPLMGQNLTTEIKEGSFAAARVHGDVRQAIVEADARALAQTIYVQLARPFAAINFGDPELAPRSIWDVSPDDDKAQLSSAFFNLAQGANQFRLAGKKIKSLSKLGSRMGMPFKKGDFTNIEPVQVEVAKVAQDGADDKADDVGEEKE